MVFLVTDSCFGELPVHLRCPLVTNTRFAITLHSADGLELPEEGLHFTG